MLSEVSQAEKDKLYMWNLKVTQMNVYTKQKQILPLNSQYSNYIWNGPEAAVVLQDHKSIT